MAPSLFKTLFACCWMWLGLLLVASTGSAALQDQESNKAAHSVSVRGTVQFEGDPLSEATVIAFQNVRLGQDASDELGEFEISFDLIQVPNPVQPIILFCFAENKLSQILSVSLKQESKSVFKLKALEETLSGRIIDNQGLGVRGAKLRVVNLIQKGTTFEIPFSAEVNGLEVSTDERGAFQLPGLDQKMVGQISVTGKGLVASSLTSENFEREIVLVAQPARTVKGTVKNMTTKAPLTNVVVRQLSGGQAVTVSESGTFELEGLPAFQAVTLSAMPSDDRPFLEQTKLVPAEQGFSPLEVELELEPGIAVDCKVNDFGTDGPAVAEVFYFPTPKNEQFQKFVQSFQRRGSIPSTSTGTTGLARVVAMKGPGVIAIAAQGYPPNESVNTLTDEQRVMLLQVTGRDNLTAVEWIEPESLEEKLDFDFLVSKGRAIEIEASDELSQPVSRLMVHRAESKTSGGTLVEGSRFSAEQFQPGEKRQIMIHAEQRRLGTLLDVEAEAKSPVKAVLRPTGSLSGQLVDKSGEPQQGLVLKFEIPGEDGHIEAASQVFTDANGRFEKPSLLAGLEYRVSAIRMSNSERMMDGSPKMDSQWVLNEDLEIGSGEDVDLGIVDLESEERPEPKRSKKMEVVETSEFPAVLAGRVTTADGNPLLNVKVSFNTWPSRSGDVEQDLKLAPLVLAEARTDSNGGFQIAIDSELQQKITVAKSDETKLNAMIVVSSDQYGTVQLPLDKVDDAQNLSVKLIREMIVRGRVQSGSESGKIQLVTGELIRVYDVESINQIVAELQSGKSLEELNERFNPIAILDPLVGGLPYAWEVDGDGSPFLIRRVPMNAIFDLTAISKSGESKTVTVVSRPIRGFEFKPHRDSDELESLQGSRVRMVIPNQEGEK